MTIASPTTDTYIPGVRVVQDRTESGSGCYDVYDGTMLVGYTYMAGGSQRVAVFTATGDSVAEVFPRSKDAVNHMVMAHRHS